MRSWRRPTLVRTRAGEPQAVAHDDLTEAVARALWAHGSGEAAYLVADLARMWDEGTLPQDPETQHSVRVIRAQAAAVLAVVRERLPVKPDRGALRVAQHRALMPQAMSIFAAVGGTQADYDALLDALADAVLDLTYPEGDPT